MRWMFEQNIHKSERASERGADWERACICRGYAKWRLNWFRLSQCINSWGSTAGHLENPKPHACSNTHIYIPNRLTDNTLNFILLHKIKHEIILSYFYTQASSLSCPYQHRKPGYTNTHIVRIIEWAFLKAQLREEVEMGAILRKCFPNSKHRSISDRML